MGSCLNYLLLLKLLSYLVMIFWSQLLARLETLVPNLYSTVELYYQTLNKLLSTQHQFTTLMKVNL